MHRGFTKRWRKRWDSDYHHDHLLFVMMEYFIDFAAWKDTKIYKKGVGMVEINRGECVYTIRELAHTLHTTPRKIRSRMNTLQTIGFLTQQTTQHHTVASIVKYDTYNPIDNINDTQDDKQATHQRHTSDTLLLKNKEGKKVRIKEEQIQVTNVTSSPPSGGNGHPPPCPHQKIISVYNEICSPHGLPTIKAWDTQAQKWLQARWREDEDRQVVEWWSEFFKERVVTSSFLTGKKKDWFADLRWIVKPSNFSKIMNGNYVDRGNNVKSVYNVKGATHGSDYYKNSQSEVGWAD